MFQILYFSIASVLASSNVPQRLSEKVLAGRFREASSCAALLADTEDAHSLPDFHHVQLYADIQLVLGRHAEAEETFRKAQKLIRHSRDAMRIASCRNAGWQAFFQNRLSTALACFRRVVDEPEATPANRLESLAGTVLVLHHLGCLDSVFAQLDAFAELAAQTGDARWICFGNALKHDLQAQYRLRCSEQLADHIYWRSAALDMPRIDGNEWAAPMSEADALMPVLALRVRYLDQISGLACGRHDVIEGLTTHLRWSQAAGLDDYHRGLCLEIALAALAGKAHGTAEGMLEQCRAASVRGGPYERWHMEYLYCLSKVRQSQGRIQEFSQYYGRYALASIQHVRADSKALPTAADLTNTAQQLRTDDVSTRLPGKYRRAYRYMMDHLDQPDLSVREIAAHIGVTERAIQAAFKAQLGLSPRELIQRQRMERIRGDLMVDGGHAGSVLTVANKWGVRNRSTLVNSYRKLFNETPSDTLAR